MVSGGITIDNMEEYIQKGSKALGIGSNLVNVSKLQTEEDYNKLVVEARRFTEKVKSFKNTL